MGEGGLMVQILSTQELEQESNKREDIELIIDDIVDTNFESDSNLKSLLKETAAHESHFGELSSNIMQVDKGEQETLLNHQYQPQLAYMGAKYKDDGKLDMDDMRTNIIAGTMRYMRTLKEKIPDTQKERYNTWKDFYNTKKGKGTRDAFNTSLDKFDMKEKEDDKKGLDLSSLNPFGAKEAQASEVSYGNRIDGTKKGRGFLGELKRPDGSISTEISIGVNIDGKEMQIPTLVPTLSEEEKNLLLSGEKPTKEIVNKAVSHARKRIEEGKSPFASQTLSTAELEGEKQIMSTEELFKAPDPNSELSFMDKIFTNEIVSGALDAVNVLNRTFQKESPYGIGRRLVEKKPFLSEEEEKEASKHPILATAGSMAGGITSLLTAMMVPQVGLPVAFGAVGALGKEAELVEDMDKNFKDQITTAKSIGQVAVAGVIQGLTGKIFSQAQTGNTLIARIFQRASGAGANAVTESLINETLKEGEPNVTKAVGNGLFVAAQVGILGLMVETPQFMELVKSEASSLTGKKLTYKQSQAVLKKAQIDPQQLSPEWQRANWEVKKNLVLKEIKQKANKYGVPDEIIKEVLNTQNIAQRESILTKYMASLVKTNPAMAKKLLPFFESIKKGADPVDILLYQQIQETVKPKTVVEQTVTTEKPITTAAEKVNAGEKVNLGNKVKTPELQTSEPVKIASFEELKIDKRKFNKGRKKTDTELAEAGKISSLMRKVKDGVKINEEILANFEGEDKRLLKKRAKANGIVDFNNWADEVRSQHPILKDKSDMELAQMVIDQEKGLAKNIAQSEVQIEKDYKQWQEENPGFDETETQNIVNQEIEEENWDEEEIETYLEGDIETESVGEEVKGYAELEPESEDPSIQEAKKYKSAEEFVESKSLEEIPDNVITKVREDGFSSGTAEEKKQIAKNRFDYLQEGDIVERTHTIQEKDSSGNYVEKVVTESGEVVIESGRKIIKGTIAGGFENSRKGLELDTGQPFALFEGDKVKKAKTKQQLTDIWNKAQDKSKGKEIGEAEKLKSLNKEVLDALKDLGDKKITEFEYLDIKRRVENKKKGVIKKYEKPTSIDKGQIKEYAQDEVKKAYGSEKEKIQATEKAAREAGNVQPSNGIREKSTISDQYKKKGFIETRGTKITTSRDVAELASLFRSPDVENLQIIYLKDGEVVAHRVLSSGAPNYVTVELAKTIYQISSAAKRLGSDSVYISHNHPVGNPKPSLQDIGFTEYVGNKLQEKGITLVGHVVIDHNKYAVIDADTLSFNKQKYIEIDFKESKEKFARDSKSMIGDQDVFEASKDLMQKGKATILFLDNANKIISADSIGIKKNIYKYVEEKKSAYNAVSYIIVTNKEDGATIKRAPNGLLEMVEIFTGKEGRMYYESISGGQLKQPSVNVFETKMSYGVQESQEFFSFEKEGEEKVRGLSKSVADQAIEDGIISEFGDLPTYRTRNMEDVAKRASAFIDKDYDLALDIALGKKPERGDLRSSELYTALRIKAFIDGDVDTIEMLALSETAISLATELGQRVKAYDSKLAFDPVRTIQDVVKTRKEVKKSSLKKDKEVETLTKKLEETEAKIADLEAKLEKLKTERKQKSVKRFGSTNTIFTQSKVDLARESLKKKLSRLHSGIDPTAIVELTTIGGYYFEGGLRTFGEWSNALVTEFGDSIKPHLTKVWKSVKTEIAKQSIEVSKAKVGKMAEDGEALPKAFVVQGIAQDLVEMGVLSRDDLVLGVQEILQESYPDITERETADLISGYGKYSKLSDEAVKVILRDIKGQLQQVSKLEDMQAGQPPSKTGVERRTPSDEERRLIKLVEQAKRKYNIKTTSPESQLKSALDSYKTRLKNQIRDLELQINERRKIVKTRSELKLDREARALLAKKNALKEAFNAVFGKTGLSRSQRIAIAEKSLTKSIAIYEEKISQGDLSPINKKPTPISTENIEILRDRRKVLKDQLNELRDLAKPKRTQAEISLQSLKTRLKNEAERLQNRLERLDLEKQIKTEIVLDAEAQKLKWERDRIKSAFKAAQYAKEGVTKEEVKNIVSMAKDAADAQKKVIDSGDWTADNAKDVEDYFNKKNDFEEYVENLKPKTKTDIVNKFFDYMRASILSSPRILRNSFLYQVVPGIERTITKRIVSGTFNDADMKSTLVEKFLAKLSGITPSAKSLDFVKRQTAMTARIYHKTGIDISRLDKMDSASKFFGERVGKFVGKSIIEKYAKIVSLGPKWFAGGTDMLFASIGRADTSIMMSKEIAKIEALKGILPKGMTEEQRADQLLKDSYSFAPKDKRANDIREAGIMDAHMMNNTQPGWWSDKVIEFRRMMKIGKLNFGKAIVPFAKIANVVAAEGVKTASGYGIAKSIYDINVANKSENIKDRAKNMRDATTNLIRYLGLTVAALLLAALLDDDDYIGSYNMLGRKEYGLARARGAGANYVRIGGKWVPLRYLPMVNIPIAAIMTARQAKKSGADPIAGYLRGMMGQIIETPGIKEVGTITTRIGYSIKADNLDKIAKNMNMDWEGLSNWAKVRMIPSVISYDVWNHLYPKDNKYDFMGREIEKTGPFKEDTSNEITTEFSRLSTAGFFPTISDPSGKYAVMLEEQLGEEKYNEVLSELKRDYASKVSKKIESNNYTRLSDEKKKKIIDKIRKERILDKIRKQVKN